MAHHLRRWPNIKTTLDQCLVCVGHAQQTHDIMMSYHIAHIHYLLSLYLFIHIPFQLPFWEHTALAAIPALETNRTHCHLYPTRYSFTPESSEACEGKVSCRKTQHRNNVPILRGEEQDISLKIVHQAGLETTRQAVTWHYYYIILFFLFFISTLNTSFQK